MAILSKIYAHIPSLIPRPPIFVLRFVFSIIHGSEERRKKEAALAH